jgi:hypothetical protein
VGNEDRITCYSIIRNQPASTVVGRALTGPGRLNKEYLFIGSSRGLIVRDAVVVGSGKTTRTTVDNRRSSP